MTALYIALGVLALLLLLAWMPVGVRVAYDAALRFQVQAGPLRFSVYPPPKAEKLKQKEDFQEEKTEEKQKKRPIRLPNRQQIVYTLDTLLPALWRALRRVGRGLRVPVFSLHIRFGGDDPADVAALYGRAQAVAGMGLPVLEQLVRFDKTDLRMETDYQAERTAISGEIAAQIRLGSLVGLSILAAKDMVSWLRGYRALADSAEEEKESSAGAAGAA